MTLKQPSFLTALHVLFGRSIDNYQPINREPRVPSEKCVPLHWIQSPIAFSFGPYFEHRFSNVVVVQSRISAPLSNFNLQSLQSTLQESFQYAFNEIGWMAVVSGRRLGYVLGRSFATCRSVVAVHRLVGILLSA